MRGPDTVEIYDGQDSETATIHVIDADRETIERVSRLAHGTSLQVQGHSSAASLWDCLSEQPHCVVLELRLPDMGGMLVFDRIRQRPTYTPVVFLTGFGTIGLAVQALQWGAVAFLEKSCRDQELWESIDRALRLQKSRTQLQAKRRLLASLSVSEREVLQSMLAGNSNRITAQQLGVSIRTVEIRRANLMKKLQISSVLDLYRLLYSAGEQDGVS